MHNRFVPIPGFEKYLINDEGKVWSTKRNKFLSQLTETSGYKVVAFYKNGKAHSKRIHRMVLETFVGPCPKGMEACHGDGNPSNNQLNNLRWGTRSDNMKDSVKHGTHQSPKAGENHPASKYPDEMVKTIIEMFNTGNYTKTQLATHFGIHKTTVSDYITGRCRSYLLKELI